jgi:ferredoxin
MKTHALTRITGAVKNQFGCVPGMMKGEYHLKMPVIQHLSSVFVDITAYLKPRLYIMDGITAMEGNGPRGGEPKKMNVLLFSTDPVALDSVFCQLINLNPEHVPFLTIGEQAGLGTAKPEEIELLGEDIKKLIHPDFKVKRGPLREITFLRHLPDFLKNLFLARPIIHYDLCTNCGSCVLQCPVPDKAVNWPGGNKTEKPVHDYKKCIHCYCCQEICPEKAISVKVPFMGKMVFR